MAEAEGFGPVPSWVSRFHARMRSPARPRCPVARTARAAWILSGQASRPTVVTSVDGVPGGLVAEERSGTAIGGTVAAFVAEHSLSRMKLYKTVTNHRPMCHTASRRVDLVERRPR